MVMATSVGVPGEGIAIILGVDRLLDMSRTVVNVTGDLSAAIYVARSERGAVPLPEVAPGGEAPAAPDRAAADPRSAG